MEEYSRSGQATGDNIIRRMRFTCRIPKATDTHSEYVILIAIVRHKKIVKRTRLNITVHVHYIACLVFKSCNAWLLLRQCLKLLILINGPLKLHG